MSNPTRKQLPTVPKLLYRREEAAYALGLSIRSIDKMIAGNRLKTRRVGRCVVIPAASVHALAARIEASDMLDTGEDAAA